MFVFECGDYQGRVIQDRNGLWCVQVYNEAGRAFYTTDDHTTRAGAEAQARNHLQNNI